MAIILVTGLPGHGKTLWTLARLKPLAEREQRPVFHASGKPVEGRIGIPGLAIDGWQEHDPLRWFDLPPNSYMVVDECQKVFPIRPRGGVVPEHVAELETHRHGGLDLYLITQHPGLVDSNVRHLCDRHFHIVRKFGTKSATIYEFPTGVQADPFKNRKREGVIRHDWRYPRKVFDWYKSAEVHTVKARLPAKFWLLIAMIVLAPVMLYLAYQRVVVNHGRSASAAAAARSASSPASAVTKTVVFPQDVDASAAAAYLEPYRPRLAGLPFTAPVYDSMTKPVEAPYPSVCGFGPEFPCRCWSQRGFALEVPRGICEKLAREPMDPYWLRRNSTGFDRGQVVDAAASAPAAGSGPEAGSVLVQAVPTVLQASSQ